MKLRCSHEQEVESRIVNFGSDGFLSLFDADLTFISYFYSFYDLWVVDRIVIQIHQML
jgi:hypothetical protein